MEGGREGGQRGWRNLETPLTRKETGNTRPRLPTRRSMHIELVKRGTKKEVSGGEGPNLEPRPSDWNETQIIPRKLVDILKIDQFLQQTVDFQPFFDNSNLRPQY